MFDCRRWRNVSRENKINLFHTISLLLRTVGGRVGGPRKQHQQLIKMKTRLMVLSGGFFLYFNDLADAANTAWLLLFTWGINAMLEVTEEDWNLSCVQISCKWEYFQRRGGSANSVQPGVESAKMCCSFWRCKFVWGRKGFAGQIYKAREEAKGRSLQLFIVWFLSQSSTENTIMCRLAMRTCSEKCIMRQNASFCHCVNIRECADRDWLG